MGGMLSGLIVAQISATVVFTAVAYLVQRQTAELTPEAVRFQAKEYLAVQFEMDPESPTEVTTDTGRERFLQRYAAMVEELERRLAANPVVEGSDRSRAAAAAGSKPRHDRAGRRRSRGRSDCGASASCSGSSAW